MLGLLLVRRRVVEADVAEAFFMGTSSLAPYGALRPLTLLLKYEVRGKFNATACSSLAIGRENKANTSPIWRAGASRTDEPISKLVKPRLAVRQRSTLPTVGSVWRHSTMPAANCRTSRMSEWRRIIGWLFLETMRFKRTTPHGSGAVFPSARVELQGWTSQ